MSNTTPPVTFPTSSTPHNGQNDYRDSTVTRATMQAHDVVDRVAGSVGPVVDRMKDVADRATGMLRLQDSSFEELQERSLAVVRNAVRKRPIAAIAIALAVGWMFSRSASR
jgi:hypothetical protein